MKSLLMKPDLVLATRGHGWEKNEWVFAYTFALRETPP